MRTCKELRKDLTLRRGDRGVKPIVLGLQRVGRRLNLHGRNDVRLRRDHPIDERDGPLEFRVQGIQFTSHPGHPFCRSCGVSDEKREQG